MMAAALIAGGVSSLAGSADAVPGASLSLRDVLGDADHCGGAETDWLELDSPQAHMLTTATIAATAMATAMRL
jgi:hypothetical protein